MSLKDQLQGLSAEEIEDRLVSLANAAGKDADRLKALELLAKIKGLIKHGNSPKEKDYGEVIFGSHTKRERDDAGGER